MGGRLVARTQTNRVQEIGEGNAAYTVDLRGDGQIQDTIRANRFTADTGISIEVGNLNGVPDNTGQLTVAIEANTIVAHTGANTREVDGEQENNGATGVELEVQGSNTIARGFAVSASLRNNRISVSNQGRNPKSKALGIGFGSVLFTAKDGTVLQQGRLSAGSLSLDLSGNRVTVTRKPGSGAAYGLHEVVEQGIFARKVTIGPSNHWVLKGEPGVAIERAPAAKP